MSISALNDALKLAKESSSQAFEPVGTKPLDEVLVSDLYAEGFESSATTSFITIIDAPGVPSTLAGNTCVANTVCLCASAETEELLPARFE